MLGEYLRTPKVSVIVTAQGAANQIQVIGEVNNLLSLSYRDGIKLLDVVVAVGGLTDFAASNRATLVRPVVPVFILLIPQWFLAESGRGIA